MGGFKNPVNMRLFECIDSPNSDLKKSPKKQYMPLITA